MVQAGQDAGRVSITDAQRVAQWLALFVVVAMLGTAVSFAWHNAVVAEATSRVHHAWAFSCFGCTMVVWLCTANHVPTFAQYNSLISAISFSLLSASASWALYVALEPHVRRRWPASMITWSRVLRRGVRHSQVGAHLLIGVTFGVAYTLLFLVGRLLGAQEGSTINLITLAGRAADDRGRSSPRWPAQSASALGIFFLFFLLRALLRRPWLAAVVFVVILAGLQAPQDHP